MINKKCYNKESKLINYNFIHLLHIIATTLSLRDSKIKKIYVDNRLNQINLYL